MKVFQLGREDGMLNSWTSDEGVKDRKKRIEMNIEKSKRNVKWNSDVKAMQEALEREGANSSIMEVFSPPRVNGMVEQLGIIPGMS